MILQSDYVILGAGLAGIHLAAELASTGADVCVIDPNGVAAGASGTPLGLVNPATGRFATKSWNASECLPAIRDHLERIQSETVTQFFKETGVLRPALSAKISERMQEHTNDPGWPDGWVQWLSEEEVRFRHPGIHVVDGGVWVPVGMTVDIATYLHSYSHWLSKEGVRFVYEDYSIIRSERARKWQITLKDDRIEASVVIDCRGVYAVSNNGWWKGLTIHPVKGQVAILEHDPAFGFDHAISALGYASSLNKGLLVIGSTYEHRFEDEQTDKRGLNYLLERLGKVLPDLIDRSRVSGQWAGVRGSTPDRKPVIGAHPEHEDLYLFSGLGSKGLLYSAWGARALKEHILNQSTLPASVDLSRFRA